MQSILFWPTPMPPYDAPPRLWCTVPFRDYFYKNTCILRLLQWWQTMMTRKITIMALIGGFVLGAAATEGYNVFRRSHDSQSFQQRVHCKAVADAYVKVNTDLRDNSETGTSVRLDKVDYSPARNSCVAAVETTTYFKGGFLVFQSVQDLLSGETLFSVKSSTDEDFDVFRFRFLPRVWDYVMNNASEPVQLEKEWGLMQSKSPPKATSAEPAQGNPWDKPQPPIDPATGKPIQVRK